MGKIPIQASAKRRRIIKLRGSSSAIQGRPRKGTRLTVQLNVGEVSEDEGGILRHKLPSKKRKKGADHSLESAVSGNKRATKK